MKNDYERKTVFYYEIPGRGMESLGILKNTLKVSLAIIYFQDVFILPLKRCQFPENSFFCCWNLKALKFIQSKANDTKENILYVFVFVLNINLLNTEKKVNAFFCTIHLSYVFLLIFLYAL